MEREELEHRLMKIESTIFAGKDVDVKEFYTLKKELIENKPFQNDLLELFLILEAMLDKQHNDLLNKRLNLLTIWSTIFLPLSFYTGIFGMNFDDVPFLNNHHGFWIFTILTIGTAVIMYFYFKRNKWI
jgi:Mg2+ and Co2+ transporter CorA